MFCCFKEWLVWNGKKPVWQVWTGGDVGWKRGVKYKKLWCQVILWCAWFESCLGNHLDSSY